MGHCLTGGDEGRFGGAGVCWKISAAAKGAWRESNAVSGASVLIERLETAMMR